MGGLESRPRLIVNADDFGRSAAINEAVIDAHQRGILTSASLMVNGDCADEAVALAKANPRLGVGLHLSLICGKSGLPHERIPGLVDRHQFFSDNPAGTGWRYFFHAALRPQLLVEIDRQFAKFHETGLTLDHVNGHLHFHMHPTILDILAEHGHQWVVRHVRLTREPLGLSLRLGRGRWLYRLSHWLIFKGLAFWHDSLFRRQSFIHARRVFGLLENGRVNECFVLGLLPALPPGVSELYSHPSTREFRAEYEALISPAVRGLALQRGIELIRYQDI